MSGIGDKPDVQAYIAYANSIRVGKLEFQNCPVQSGSRCRRWMTELSAAMFFPTS